MQEKINDAICVTLGRQIAEGIALRVHLEVAQDATMKAYQALASVMPSLEDHKRQEILAANPAFAAWFNRV